MPTKPNEVAFSILALVGFLFLFLATGLTAGAAVLPWHDNSPSNSTTLLRWCVETNSTCRWTWDCEDRLDCTPLLIGSLLTFAFVFFGFVDGFFGTPAAWAAVGKGPDKCIMCCDCCRATFSGPVWHSFSMFVLMAAAPLLWFIIVVGQTDYGNGFGDQPLGAGLVTSIISAVCALVAAIFLLLDSCCQDRSKKNAKKAKKKRERAALEARRAARREKEAEAAAGVGTGEKGEVDTMDVVVEPISAPNADNGVEMSATDY